MTFLPIVERELRVRARLGATYHGRWITVLVALLISVPFLLMSSPGQGGSGDGQILFYVFTTLAFLYSLFGGARLTSDSLSSEKRDGTLGLLFLTHLKGYDVVLGKLVSNSLSSFYGLLAVMPVFGLALLMGGVTGGEFWRVTLVLINTLFFSLAVGLWISARSRDEQKIMVGTNLLLITIAGGLPLLEFLVFGNMKHGTVSLFSPAYACSAALDIEYKTYSWDYWISLCLVHSLGWTFLALAARAALRYREDDLSRELTAPASRQTKILGRWVPSFFARPSRRLALASLNPVYWLAHCQGGQKALIWSLTILRLGVIALNTYLILVLRGIPVTSVAFYFRTIFLQIISLIFWYAVAMVSCRFFAQARRDGTLELLFSTPLTDRTILDGLRLHLKNLLMAPVICIIVAQLANTLVIMSIANNSSMIAWYYFVAMLVSVVSFCVEAMAFCYVGMWLSASMKRPALAAPITFVLLALVPLLFCSSLPNTLIYSFLARYGRATGISLISLSSPILLIFVWLILIRWARGRLHRGVRAVILHQPIPISIRL